MDTRRCFWIAVTISLCLVSMEAWASQPVNTASSQSQTSDISSQIQIPEYFHYAASGDRIYYGVVSNELVVQFQTGVTSDQIDALNANYNVQVVELIPKSEDNEAESVYQLQTEKEPSLSLHAELLREYASIITWVMPVLHHFNTRIFPTDEFSVSLAPGASVSELSSLNQTHHVEQVGVSQDGSYRLRVTPTSDRNAWEMANLYHARASVAHATPVTIPGDVIDDPEVRQYFRYHDMTPVVHFEVDPNAFVVQFKSGVTESAIEALNAQYQVQVIVTLPRGRKRPPIYLLQIPSGKRVRDYVTPYGKRESPAQRYGDESIVAWTGPAITYRGSRNILTESFSVFLKPGVPESVLREFNLQHGVVENATRSWDLPTGRVYVLHVTEKSELNALDMANLYWEQPFAE